MHYGRIELPMEWPIRGRIEVVVVVAVALHAAVLLLVSLGLGARAGWVAVGLG